MKNKLFIARICILIIASIAVVIIFVWMKSYIDPSFATEVSLKYYYSDKKIDVIITDENDVAIIRENLKGLSFNDSPSCGFSLDISLTFSDGGKSIVLCPARDNCSIARVGDSNRYINIKDRDAIEAILEKYGMIFPCV